MTIKVPTRQDIGVHRITDGLTPEWKHNGKIAVFTWNSVSRETIDAHVETYKAVVKDWPVEEPIRHLNDLRFDGFSFSPYLRKSVQDIIAYADQRGLKGRVANVLNPGASMRVVQFFLRVTKFKPGVYAEFFADFNKAMEWLER